MANLDNESKFILEDIQKKLKSLEENQKTINEQISKMEQILNHIKEDIYSEEEFDFEIVCPYCEHEFVVDLDEEKTEIECPECKNMIDLDWSGDLDEEGCSGHCLGCSGCEDLEDDM